MKLAFTHHLLCHLFRHILVKLKQELDGIVVLVLAMELLGAIHAQPELQAGLLHVIFFCQLHTHTIVLLEEYVLQQVLNGVSVRGDEWELIDIILFQWKAICLKLAIVPDKGGVVWSLNIRDAAK